MGREGDAASAGSDSRVPAVVALAAAEEAAHNDAADSADMPDADGHGSDTKSVVELAAGEVEAISAEMQKVADAAVHSADRAQGDDDNAVGGDREPANWHHDEHSGSAGRDAEAVVA